MAATLKQLLGQRNKKCDIINCKELGRVLASMSGIEICYCPKHRKKYGERIINALINSVFNFRLTNFLYGVKKDIFLSDNFLCTACAQKMSDYISDKAKEMDAIEKNAKDNEDNEDIDDIELNDENENTNTEQ